MNTGRARPHWSISLGTGSLYAVPGPGESRFVTVPYPDHLAHRSRWWIGPGGTATENPARPAV